MEFIITATLGAPANLFVLYLSFFSPLVSGDFKYFLANLAICDEATDLFQEFIVVVGNKLGVDKATDE